MASIHHLRNDAVPVRSTSSLPSNPNPSIAEQGARWLAQRAANHEAPLDDRISILLPRELYVQPADLQKFINDDPMFGSRGAAVILGVSLDLVKQWRRRGEGPEYYQFGERGPILYSLRALNEFKAAHLVIPTKKGRKK
jgi:hypothetical protein